MSTILQRTTAGLLFFDDFTRADGAVGNGWTADRGTWTISSNALVVTTGASASPSPGTRDRLRQTSIVSNRHVVEFRAQLANSSAHFGALSVAGAGPTTDAFELVIRTNPGGSLDQNAQWRILKSGVETAATLFGGDFPGGTITTATWYRIKAAVDASGSTPNVNRATTQLVVDGTLMSPYSPHDFTQWLSTDPGSPGLCSYGGPGATFDEVVIYRSLSITVGSLQSGQGVRLCNASSTLLAQATESSGTATLDVTLLDHPLTGYLQVYSDPGVWLNPVSGLRYPLVGNADDLAGGDEFSVVAAPDTASYLVQVNWTNTTTWPDFWEQDYSELPCPSEILIDRESGMPDAGEDRVRIKFQDVDAVYVPGHTASPLYPDVEIGRPLRVLADYGGTRTILFYGETTLFRPALETPYTAEIEAEGKVARLLGVKITPVGMLNAVIYDPDRPGRSALTILLNALAAAGSAFTIPTDQRVFTTDLTPLASWGGAEHTLADHLADLASKSGAVWGLTPVYRTTAGGGDWQMFWRVPSDLVDETAAWAWATGDGATGDADGLELVYRTPDVTTLAAGA